MELAGAAWPFWVRLVGIVAGVAVLCALAWRWAGREHSALTSARGLFFWWMLAAVPWVGQDAFYARFGRASLALPGADWEYRPAPADPAELVLFLVLGALIGALLLGAPLAALIATARTLSTGGPRLREQP